MEAEFIEARFGMYAEHFDKLNVQLMEVKNNY